jgi:hypothetical protein
MMRRKEGVLQARSAIQLGNLPSLEGAPSCE